MTMACTICHRPAGISDDDDDGCPPVDLGRCAASGGFECRAVGDAYRRGYAEAVADARRLAEASCGYADGVINWDALEAREREVCGD